MEKVKITIDILERMLKNAKAERAKNILLSDVIEITLVNQRENPLVSDHIAAHVLNHAGSGKLIFNHWE